MWKRLLDLALRPKAFEITINNVALFKAFSDSGRSPLDELGSDAIFLDADSPHT
jgi:hypothetical protein